MVSSPQMSYAKAERFVGPAGQREKQHRPFREQVVKDLQENVKMSQPQRRGIPGKDRRRVILEADKLLTYGFRSIWRWVNLSKCTVDFGDTDPKK